jgi:putative transposase
MIGVMPQSLSKVILHVIFSTKNRELWLDFDVRQRTHVHIIMTLPRTVSQSELIEQIKKTSSKWVKTVGSRYRGFSWQRGYGAFSISPSQLDAVLQYADMQQEHHRTRTFQEE